MSLVIITLTALIVKDIVAQGDEIQGEDHNLACENRKRPGYNRMMVNRIGGLTGG